MWLVVANFLAKESFFSCSCSGGSGHNVPINFQQDNCYSLFCNFLSLYEWKHVIPLKVRALKMGSPVYFRLIGNILLLLTKDAEHRLQNTRLELKNKSSMESALFLSVTVSTDWVASGLVGFSSELPSSAELRGPGWGEGACLLQKVKRFPMCSFLQGAWGQVSWALSCHRPACCHFPPAPCPLPSHAKGLVAPTPPLGKKPTGKWLPAVGQEARGTQAENGLLFLICGWSRLRGINRRPSSPGNS